MNLAHYARIWLTAARYSVVRTLMFRGDFIIWALVELFWMTVNLLMISVIYQHTDSVAGWSKYEMMLLVGTSLLIQRFLMGFFWSSIFRDGTQHPQRQLRLLPRPTRQCHVHGHDPEDRSRQPAQLAYRRRGGRLRRPAARPASRGSRTSRSMACSSVCGVIIHYSMLVLCITPAFWITSAQGIEGSYFTLSEFSRLPREAFRGVANIALRLDTARGARQQRPRAALLLRRLRPGLVLWLLAAAADLVRPRRLRLQPRSAPLHQRQLMTNAATLDALQPASATRFAIRRLL
jgi:ABC-2 type transport system permease protein